jgi:hypothetical protein
LSGKRWNKETRVHAARRTERGKAKGGCELCTIDFASCFCIPLLLFVCPFAAAPSGTHKHNSITHEILFASHASCYYLIPRLLRFSLCAWIRMLKLNLEARIGSF